MNQAIQGLKPALLAAMIVLSLGSAAHAQFTVPYTFSNGSAADANQVNANFDAIESAVNAANTAINGKLTNSIGSCAVGYAIRAINTVGGVTCQKVHSGVISVSSIGGTPFTTPMATQMRVVGGGMGRAGLTSEPNSSTYLMVNVQFPHGITLTGMTYRVYDASTTYGSTAYLFREPGRIMIGSTGTTPAETSTSIWVKSTTLNHTVDVATYGYYLYLDIRQGVDADKVVPITVHFTYTY
jgi:hypothetical protein